eukprot:gene7709-biopygen19584
MTVYAGRPALGSDVSPFWIHRAGEPIGESVPAAVPADPCHGVSAQPRPLLRQVHRAVGAVYPSHHRHSLAVCLRLQLARCRRRDAFACGLGRFHGQVLRCGGRGRAHELGAGATAAGG